MQLLTHAVITAFFFEKNQKKFYILLENGKKWNILEIVGKTVNIKQLEGITHVGVLW